MCIERVIFLLIFTVLFCACSPTAINPVRRSALALSTPYSTLLAGEEMQLAVSGMKGNVHFEIISGGGTVYDSGLFIAPNRESTVVVRASDNVGYSQEVRIQVVVPTQISVGRSHTCMRTSDSRAQCWGMNYSGQLGDGTTSERSTPVLVNLTDIAQISAGATHTCALKNNGTVWCWGANNAGLGNGIATSSPTPIQVSGITTAASIANSSSWHTCVILADQTARCWGEGLDGQLGQGANTASAVPVDPGLASLTKVVVGYAHTCFLKGTDVHCTGLGTSGQIGDGNGVSVNIPTQSTIANVSDLSTGGYSNTTCAVSSNQVHCWGMNSYRGVGDGTTTNQLGPVSVINVPTTSTVTSFSVGYFFGTGCASFANGESWCWGYNEYGTVGNHSARSFYSAHQDPQIINEILNPRSMALGWGLICWIDQDYAVYCKGNNSLGMMGSTRIRAANYVPNRSSNLDSFTSISHGWRHSCGIKSDGTAWCWGYNDYGQLGNGTTTTSYTPVQVSGITGVTSIAAGGMHSCAVVAAGAIKCWGRNSRGQFGDSTLVSSSTPVNSLAGASTFIAAGFEHTCSLTVAGPNEVQCWGDHTYGQGGDATATGGTKSTPVSIAGGYGSVLSLSAGAYHTCLVNAAVVRCWGLGTSGQLGNGASATSSTPVGIAAATVTQLSAGDYHTCARHSTGVVTCWGSNTRGCLGNNSSVSSNIPVAATGITNATVVTAGPASSCALLSTGGVYCWGDNTEGGLGISDLRINSAIPVSTSVSGLTAITAGAHSQNFCGKNSSGQWTCWGQNSFGQDGNEYPSTSLSRVRAGPFIKY